MFRKNACFTLAFSVLLLGFVNTADLRAAEPVAKYLADELSEHIVSASQGWGTMGINTSAYGDPAKPLKLRIKDKNYKRGIGTHANGEITVGLFGTFKTFEAEVGIQWQGGQDTASAIFQVYVDGRKRFDSGVMCEGDAPRKVSVSVKDAVQLRLVSLDAGDYITCDCCNWADARLTTDPTAKRQPYVYKSMDVGRFGRVVTWDSKQAEGTKAKRTQEFPAADVVLYRELLPETDGTYKIPADKSRTGCIGLRWDQPRPLRSVSLKFADAKAMPDVKDARLQCWKGESIWQGKWHTLTEPITVDKDTWACKINLKSIPRGTQKIRWILPATLKPLAIKAVSAASRTLWPATTLRLEAEDSHKGPKIPIEIYNGQILKGDGKQTTNRIDWDTNKPLELNVRFGITGQLKSGQTVLRFQYPQSPFGVAVENVLTNDCVYVPHAGLFVTRTPAPVTLDEYRKKIADKTTVLDAVRKLPDQSFSQALAKVHNPAQNHGPTLLSLAHDNRKFTAHRDGTISYPLHDKPDASYKSVVYYVNLNKATLDCAQLRPMFGDGKPQQVTRHMDGDWLPIPVTVVHNGGLVYRQRTCVAPIDDAPPAGAPDWLRRRDACVVEYTIENPTVAVTEANLQLAFYANAKQKTKFKLEKSKTGFLVTGGDRLVGTIDSSQAGPLVAKVDPAGTVKFNGKLAPGGKARVVACLPAWKTGREDAKLLNGNAPWTDKVEAYWTRLFQPAMQVELPDPLLNNVIRASQLHCMLAARNEARGKRVSAWIGSDRYGPLESETHAVIRGMDMVGQADFARRGLKYLIHRFNKNGYLTTGYTIVGTGEHLWTLAEHVARTGDLVWLKKNAPELARVAKWVMQQRARTKLKDVHGEKLPEYGLMTPGVSADWNRYCYRFFNDAQYFAGLREIGRVLATINHPDADAILKDAATYREDILRAYQWSQARSPVVPLADGTWVPDYPGMLYCFGPIEGFCPGEDGNRSWCYNIELGAHHLAATEVLDPKSLQTDWVMNHMEDKQFLRTGKGDYAEPRNRADVFSLGGFAKIQPYYARNAEVCALRDDVKPFIRSYFNAIPSLLSLENLSFWEHFHNIGGWNKTHETGWFLCQTAIMLVQERGDELWLAPFVSTHWMKDGMKIAVSQAPTRFGQVAYTIRSSVKDGHIEAQITPPKRSVPKSIVIRLRHPDGKPIKSVTVDGKPHKNFNSDKEYVRISPAADTKPIVVRALY